MAQQQQNRWQQSGGYGGLQGGGYPTTQVPPAIQTPHPFSLPASSPPPPIGGFPQNPQIQGVPTATPVIPPTTAPTPQQTETQKAWDKYLLGDPFYTQTVGQISAQGQSDAAERDRLLSQMLIQFGEIPQGYTGPGATDLNRGLANDATTSGMSILARLQKAAADQRRSTTTGLAARGMMQSGELGYQLGQNALQSNQSQYDARSALLNSLYGTQHDFSQSEMQRKLAQIQAQFEAAQRGAASGVGPLVAGFGQDTPSFVLNPIGNISETNAGYYAGQTNPAQAPPGYHYVGGSSGAQLIQDAPALDQPYMGYPSYQAWLDAWNKVGTGAGQTYG